MVEPISTTLGVGVVTNFLYDALKASSITAIQHFSPAAFTASRSLLREADREFERAKRRILEKYADCKAVEVFLTSERSIKGGVLNPLFEHLFLGVPLDKKSLQRSLNSCRGSHETIQPDPSIIIDNICEIVKNTLASNTAFQGNVFLRNCFEEMNKAFASLSYLATEIASRPSAADIEASKIDAFTRTYLTNLQQSVESLIINGLDAVLKKERIRHRLQKSYVPLSIYPNGDIDAEHTLDALDQSRPSDWRGNAFDVVSSIPRIVVRGPAGCGKTTLMQWFISHCRPIADRADRDAPIETDCLPFFPIYVPLRRIEAEHLTSWTLEDAIYCSIASPSQRANYPANWVSNLHAAGLKVVILFDGVDELTEHNRANFWQMINKLASDANSLRIIITSRHLSAVHLSSGQYRDVRDLDRSAYLNAKLQWSIPTGFLEFLISPLTYGEIWDFIDRWHLGVDEAFLPQSDTETIHRLPERLKSQLFGIGHEHALELARVPLLCSLVCMVHFLQNGRLPSNKRQLYELATKLLVATRDEHRGVRGDSEFREFDLDRRLQLLRHLALIMQEGIGDESDEQTIEADKTAVLQWITNWLDRKASKQVSASDLLGFIVDRCSILREPVAGKIDFAHRSFMEFLAANELVLVREPHAVRNRVLQDQWLSTLQFAMDTESGSAYFAGALIEEIISFLQKPKRRREDWLRAASLLKNANRIPDKFLQSVGSLAKEVLPPCNASEVDDLLGIPFDILVRTLSWGDVKKSGVEGNIWYSALLLSEHHDPRCAEILLTGYEKEASKDIIHFINRSGKLRFIDHFALVRRLENRSYSSEVWIRPSELEERELRHLLPKRVGLIFPIEGDRFVGWVVLSEAAEIRMIEASRRDWELINDSANIKVFVDCARLTLSSCSGVSFSEIARLFPNLEVLEVSYCHTISTSELVSFRKLRGILFANCSQPIDIDLAETNPQLRDIVFWRCTTPRVLNKERTRTKIHFESDDKAAWLSRIGGLTF